MPRPKKPGSAEPKKRSRNGCWQVDSCLHFQSLFSLYDLRPCKNRKIKCGEERPHCSNCEKAGETCDYSIRLNWEGRTKRKGSHENKTMGNSSSPPLTLSRSASCNSNNASTIKGSSPNPTGGFMVGQFSSSGSATTFHAQPPYRDHISTSQLSRIRDQGIGPYPSPADSSMESPPLHGGMNGSYGGHHYSLSNPEMPPPFHSPSYPFSNQNNMYGNPGLGFADRRSKKLRLSPSMDRTDMYQKGQGTQANQFVQSGGLFNMNPLIPSPASRYHSSSPSNLESRVPLTPAASVGSDENYHPLPVPSPQPVPQESAEFRRLSVKSLLSEDSPPDSTSGSDNIFPGKLNISSFNSSQKTLYGVDRGFSDLDLPRNQDATALNGVTPMLGTVNLDNNEGEINNDLCSSGFAFGLNTADGFQEGQGYYAKPVTVSISRTLEPLPAMLRDNPMNLLYFHHFLNHTARILVPHDCSENPFKSILPQMAVQDTNLLNLLLTYSASHRSRLLNDPEPNNRIAIWMSDVFPSLSRALDDPSRQISNSNLATAIMLASLQILNPNTFGMAISWQQHLNIARQMIEARGGANSVKRKDKVSYFLTRWFAYLDVLGSLSGGKYDQPLFGGNYWAHDHSDHEEDYQIDCLLGFTSRCVSILAKIAELARICDGERIDSAGNVLQGWQPSPETVQQAVNLKNDLIEARQHHYQGCPHRRASTQIEDSTYAVELVTTNEAFHHAGFIHVNRRILGRPSTDPEVQCAVREIVSALYKVRKGGTAEGCLLFPMFTAGCDAQEESQKAKILERLQRMEGLGMSHVKKARALMEKVWKTGRAWETLVTGDFFLG